MKRSTLAKRIGKVVLDICQIPRLNKQGGFIRYTKPIDLRKKHYAKGDIVTRRIKSMKEFRKYYKPLLAGVRNYVIGNMVKQKENASAENKANEANDNTNSKVINELNMNNNNNL